MTKIRPLETTSHSPLGTHNQVPQEQERQKTRAGGWRSTEWWALR